jgi:hypothetical protein
MKALVKMGVMILFSGCLWGVLVGVELFDSGDGFLQLLGACQLLSSCYPHMSFSASVPFTSFVGRLEERAAAPSMGRSVLH